MTDLISHTSPSGLGVNLLISDKLKTIFEEQGVADVQYFRSDIIHKKRQITGYWLMYPYELSMHLIDYSKSEIYITKVSGFKIDPDPMYIASYDEYEIMNRELAEKGYKDIKVRAKLTIEKAVLKEEVNQPLINVTSYRGSRHLVSEELKQKIEATGCTGIEFKPSEINNAE